MSWFRVTPALTALALLIWMRGEVRGQARSPTVHSEGVPDIPKGLFDELKPYQFLSDGNLEFVGWLGGHRQVVYISTAKGLQQGFLSASPGATRQLTMMRRSVRWAVTSPKLDRFVFALDPGGRENYQLYLHDVSTGLADQFAGGPWLNGDAVWSRNGKTLAFASNARNGKDRDLYIVNPPDSASGRRIHDVDGWCIPFDWSPDGSRIVANDWRPSSGEYSVMLIDVVTGRVEELPKPLGNVVIPRAIRWSMDGNSLYWLTSRDSEFDHLASYDIRTGIESSMTKAIPWDVDRYDLSDDGQFIALVANEDGWSRIHVINARTPEETKIVAQTGGIVSRIKFRPGSHEFTYSWACAQSPPGIYSYDLDTEKESAWVTPKSVSDRSAKVPSPQVIRYPSFDGTLIPAFVRRPRAGPPIPSPVLIAIHGGPTDQSRPRNAYVWNYLTCEMGITVVEPNYRGSLGYGQSYTHLDNGLRRENAVRDIGSLLDWIAKQQDLDPSRVVVMGASYGGFLALSAMVHYGDRLRGCIDVSGISSFERFVKGTRSSDLAFLRLEFGDEREPEMAEFLERISPLHSASKIRKPLLVIHGANDPRVPVGEAEQIVAAFRRNGVPVWYVRFENEGHGNWSWMHEKYEIEAEIMFLRRYLLDLGDGSRKRTGP